jgi:hypothetical protein
MGFQFNFQFPAIVKAIFAYVPGAQWLYRVRLHWAVSQSVSSSGWQGVKLTSTCVTVEQPDDIDG